MPEYSKVRNMVKGRQTDSRTSRNRETDPRTCPGEQATDHHRSRSGHHGKSTRSLGKSLRGSGFGRDEQQTMTAAWSELTAAGVGTRAASTLTGLVRSTATRRRTAAPLPTPPTVARPAPVNKLSDLERRRVLDVLKLRSIRRPGSAGDIRSTPRRRDVPVFGVHDVPSPA